MSSLTALESLVSMGFPKEKGKALSVNKGNIDASIEWIMNNPDDGNNGGGNSNSSSTTTTTSNSMVLMIIMIIMILNQPGNQYWILS